MIFLSIGFLILGFIHVSCGEEAEVTEIIVKKKLDVIIFFTHVDSKCVSLQKDTLGFLHLHQATRVKHCIESETTAEEEILNDEKKGSAHCKELLKSSLMSLTHYCHTVLKMKTAIASVSSKETTNDIQEPDAPFHETNIGLFPQSPPKTKRSQSNFEMKQMQRKPLDNTISSKTMMKKTKAKNYITGSKHKEVFKIRPRRRRSEIKEENKDKIKRRRDYQLTNEVPFKRSHTRPPWDVLDVMKHVRYSFLGNMINNNLEHEIKADQDELVDISKIGTKKQDPGLFSMVKSTLANLQEPPETSFLLVVFGGHFHAITDKNSPIVQSIKHVIEMTDPDKTLIIVTGSCAEDPVGQEQGKEIENSELNLGCCTVPVYAKGPESTELAHCALLYDIPLTVRKILEINTQSGLPLSEPLNSNV